jgi:hypothetical protein
VSLNGNGLWFTALILALLTLGSANEGSAAGRTLSIASPRFAPSCSPDLSADTLPPHHGFLTVHADGHFYWPNGARQRFWGINVSSTRVLIPTSQIDETVKLFARTGINLVRFEAIDNRNCLLGNTNAADSQHFSARYVDALDHWIAALHKAHLGYYLDLLDLRTFKAGDGVPNAALLRRAARPYAFFDPKLIALQMQYAKMLLTHVNPYTGLSPVNDPDLVMLEICNENGMFLYMDKLPHLVSPYRQELAALWNDWLLKRYQTGKALDTAWSMPGGTTGLAPNEHLLAGTVAMPQFTSSASPLLHNPKRLKDGVRFLGSIERNYFLKMKSFIRGLGLKIPVTGVVSSTIVPDLASVVKTCDFTAENWYGEAVDYDTQVPGRRYYDDNDPLGTDGLGGFAPFTSCLHWAGKPAVIREWDTTWPNQWRSSSVPEVLAYASLQDYDAVILFGYQTNIALNGAGPEVLNDFAVQADPTVWGLYGLAGWAFMHRDIAPAIHTVSLNYPPGTVNRWPNDITQIARAAWSVKLQSSLAAPLGPLSLIPDSLTGPLQLQGLMNALFKRGANISATSPHTGTWVSDTGEITLNTQSHLLVVDAPSVVIVAGHFIPGHLYRVGSICFTTATPYGAFMAIALDGRMIRYSNHLVVKMVSTAVNSGQQLRKSPHGAPAEWMLTNAGTVPVLTGGVPSAIATKVWIAPDSTAKRVSPLLSMNMANGVWELNVDHGKVNLVCDTAGISGNAAGLSFLTPVTGAVEPGSLTEVAVIGNLENGHR